MARLDPEAGAPVGKDSRGYDANKKINGRKRFIVTDTAGLLITVAVPAASWQDRDGGKTALLGMYLTSPVWYVFADQGFAGRFVDWARDALRTAVEIVRKPAEQRGFAVHPRRGVVERTLAWLTVHRRLARDYERQPEVPEAFIRWAAINDMLRRITRGDPARRQLRRTFTTRSAGDDQASFIPTGGDSKTARRRRLSSG